MIKVGSPKGVKLNCNGKEVLEFNTYTNIKQDIDGWVDARHYVPADFDLCQIKIKDKKSRMGWVQGRVWDGLKLVKNDEILYWKRTREK